MLHGLQNRLARLARPLLRMAMMLASLAAPAGAATLHLNEFLAGPARDWDGSGTVSTRDDEWVEVMNDSSAALDLAGYLITDGDSLPRIALSGTLGPGERRVVTGRESFDWERAHGFPAFGLSLGNTGDAVILWRVEGADTTVIDAYTYRSHEAAADRAVGRLDDTGGWTLFDALNPYAGTAPPNGTGCAPTPAAANACSATPSRRTTWGALKMLYR